jgi:TonB family protein
VGSGAVSYVEVNPVILEQVTDTIALLRALAGEPAVASAADSVLLRIGYDSTGALTPVSVFGVDIPQGESARIEEVVTARLAPSNLPRSYGTFLFVRGPRPRLLPFRHTSERGPRLLNRQEISIALQSIATRQGYRDRSATIWIYVTSRGEPARAEVHGSSGSIETDRELLAVARRARFSPARMDRFPVAVWVALPLSIRGAHFRISPGDEPLRIDPMVGRGRRDW